MSQRPPSRAGDNNVGHGSAEKSPAVSQRIKQRSSQLHLFSSQNQPIPKIGDATERTEQAINVSQLAQALLKVAILHHMRRRMQHHIDWAKALERGTRYEFGSGQELLRIRMQASAQGQD